MDTKSKSLHNRDRRSKIEQEEEPKKKKKPPKKRWLIILSFFLGFVILVFSVAVMGAYYGAVSVPPPVASDYDEDEDTTPIEVLYQRQARLLDIAREKFLHMSGDLKDVINLDVGMNYPGRATESFGTSYVDPELKLEISRPFELKPESDRFIDTSLSAVSENLERLGGLGGNESLARQKTVPRAPSETEPEIPLNSTQDIRELSAEDKAEIFASTHSTIPTPIGYTEIRMERRRDMPEHVEANKAMPDFIRGCNEAPIESNPKDESYTRGNVN